ncbi:helix-turn-helix domain-containing protein [Pseudosporangium ferrugineum]|nr:helix-turn-helix domain-containing protein [Pseudosporangium ferrugineum]
MMRVVFCSDDLPVAERFAGFREVLAGVDVPVDVRVERDAAIRVRMSAMALGRIDVASIVSDDDARLEVDRPARLVRRSDPDAFRLLVSLRGHTEMTQGGRSPALEPDRLAFYDTSRPFHGWRRPIDGRSHLVMLTFPRGLLPVPPNLVRRLVGVPILGDRGVAALMVDVVKRVLTDAAGFTAADTVRVSTVVADLMTAVLGHELGRDAVRAASSESRRRVLRAGIQSYVQQRLGDPELTPATIAAAHHISPRLLHKLFQEQGTTVAGSIRAARLERCRADLADPLHAACPAGQIAARWGFANYAHFSNLFRATYGVGPRDWRHHRLG